jgi:hypothetical protein
MGPEYKKAVKYALEEKKLWLAGLFAALAFSEAWWILFDWGPEYLGERWERAVSQRLGDGATFVVFILMAIAAFVVLKALGYLGEMVLVRQVADGESVGVYSFSESFSSSRGRYIPFAITLLPWDALHIAVIYLPALIIIAWDRWDPHLDHLLLYLLAFLIWFGLLVAAYILAGIPATLAARFSLLRKSGFPGVWIDGWRLFRLNAGKCIAVWLQAVAADILFVVIAFPLAVLIPWLSGEIADPIGFAPARWLIYAVAYTLYAGGLIVMQTLVQCYRSSLWTVTFLALAEEERMAKIDTGYKGRPDAVVPLQMPDLPEPPTDFMP